MKEKAVHLWQSSRYISFINVLGGKNKHGEKKFSWGAEWEDKLGQKEAGEQESGRKAFAEGRSPPFRDGCLGLTRNHSCSTCIETFNFKAEK